MPPNPKPLLVKKEPQYSFLQLIKDCWMFLEDNRLKFFFFTSLLLLAQMGSFGTSYLLGKIIDFLTNFNESQSLTIFYFFIGGIAFIGAMQVWLRFFAKWRVQQLGAELRMKTRVMALSKLMDIELKWHEKEETGGKIQKISNGGDSIHKAFDMFANEGVNILTGICGSLILFLFLDIRYTLFAIGYMAIYLSGEFYFNKKISYLQDEMNKVREKVSGKIHESASNVLTVKSLGLKEVLKKSTENYEKEYLEIWMKNKQANQMKTKAIKIFSALGYAGFILFIGLDAIKGIITVGSVVMLSGYFTRVKSSIEELTNNLTRFIEVKSGVGRLMTILDRRTIERESSKLQEIQDNWKEIEFKNISFKYKDKWVLKEFNLKIKKGESLGLVGRSGCGKSTLVKLLLGLYKVNSGEITIDKIPLEKYKQSSINKRIAIVLQDSEMFNSSLKDNIAITSENGINEPKLEKAINLSQLDSLIKKLPKGIDTLIGEKGYKVSGGERQRIGIARAIYRDSDILVLDEATSHLDSKTEANIKEEIKTLSSTKTLITIAHRFSTLKDTDRIIVLEEGKIIEQGSFNNLISKKGKFYELWNQQKSKG